MHRFLTCLLQLPAGADSGQERRRGGAGGGSLGAQVALFHLFQKPALCSYLHPFAWQVPHIAVMAFRLPSLKG